MPILPPRRSNGGFSAPDPLASEAEAEAAEPAGLSCAAVAFAIAAVALTATYTLAVASGAVQVAEAHCRGIVTGAAALWGAA